MILRSNRFWIDFDKWEVFVNDDCTRTFLSLEVTGVGLAEVIPFSWFAIFLCYVSWSAKMFKSIKSSCLVLHVGKMVQGIYAYCIFLYVLKCMELHQPCYNVAYSSLASILLCEPFFCLLEIWIYLKK